MNKYGYAVFGNGKTPLHIVQIRHCLFAGFAVFSNARDAKNYIENKKTTLPELTYDPDFNFSKSLVEYYTKAKGGLFSKLENKQMYIAAI